MLFSLGFIFTQPGNIEVVVASLDLIPSEAAEAALLALILALAFAVRIVAESLLEVLEIASLSGASCRRPAYWPAGRRPRRPWC